MTNDRHCERILLKETKGKIAFEGAGKDLRSERAIETNVKEDDLLLMRASVIYSKPRSLNTNYMNARNDRGQIDNLVHFSRTRPTSKAGASILHYDSGNPRRHSSGSLHVDSVVLVGGPVYNLPRLRE